MKKNFGLILAIALGLSALLLTIAFQSGWVNANPFAQQERAGAPTIVSYQGQIWDGDEPYDGSGYFKFAIVDLGGTTTYWSNDGTSTGGAEPTASVSLGVDNGLFSILLGDTSLTHMTSALDETVFNDQDTYLRVWFSNDEDVAFTQLSDQKIAAVPYAFQAQVAIYADDADTLDTKHAAAFQLRVTGSCIAGSSIRGINTDGTVTCETDDNMWYTNGTGILLVGNTFSADPDYLQRRVITSCVEGSAIKTINSDGSVDCETVEQLPRFSLSTIDSTGDVGQYTSTAIGPDGLGLISYYDITNGDLKVAHCNDAACSSASTYTLDSKDDVGSHTAITIGSDGLGLISYYDATNQDLKVAHCSDITCSSASNYTLDSIGNVGKYPSIAIGSDGLGLISYYNQTNADLKVAHCSDITCTSASTYTLDSSDILGWDNSIAIGSDGLGLISYYNFTQTSLKVAHCSNADCSSASTYTLDSTGDVGQYTAIAIGTDGLGLISYRDSTNDYLKVAHCSNTACSSASTYTLDSTGYAGYNSSIAIGIDGLGLISYFDGSPNLDLKVAHCSNTACSSSFTYTLDSTGSVGDSTAVAIGPDGLGLISYRDLTNYDLKVAHCNNFFCNPDY